MKQAEVISILKIHLPNDIFNKRVYRYRLQNGIYCYKSEKYLRDASVLLCGQLSELINENDIDLMEIRKHGLLSTVKNGICPKQSAENFQFRILRRHSEKLMVIDNMLYAILLIDLCINSNNLNL